MSVKASSLRTLLVCSVIVCLKAGAVHAVGYEIVSLAPNRAQIRFMLDDNEINGMARMQPVMFGFSSGPDIAFRASVLPGPSPVAAGPSRKTGIPVSVLSKGQVGQSYVQWLSFAPVIAGRSGVQTAVSQGTIVIDFATPVVKSSDKAWVQNGILHMGIVTGLAKPASPRKATAPGSAGMPFSTGLIMFVDRDGVYQLTVTDLRRLGVPVDRVQSRYFKIFTGVAEIPLYITNSQRTMLGSDDVILFYATSLRGTSTYYSQFSNSNAYWLTWQADRPGIRIAEVSGAVGKDTKSYSVSGANSIQAHEFLDTVHLEQDNHILSLGTVDNVQDMSDSSQSLDVDNWYWASIGRNSLTNITLTVPSPTTSSEASKVARLRIRLQGTTSDPNLTPDHRLAVYLNGDTLGTAQWDGQTLYDFVSPPFSSSRLSAGANTLTFSTQASAANVDQSELNWIDIEYYRSFSCLDNMISFKNAAQDTNGVFQFSITGFTGSSIDLWDLSTHRLYTNFEIDPVQQKGNPLYTAVFQDSLNGVHRFLAQAKSLRLTPSAMALDTIKTNWDQAATVDYIIVVPDSFITDIAPLVDAYKKRNMTVAIVDISDVYNSFSFGVRDPESVRTMLLYLLSVPGAHHLRYLLLGGDTSHDLDKMNKDRNIVPTHLAMVPGWGPASDDGYFASVSGDDNFPDLYVGRFPAGNRSDMKSMVAKTVRYLTALATGPWRDNLMMLGGAESDFTTFNDQAITDILGSKVNLTRLDGDPASLYYRDASVASKEIAGYINAGLYAINFNGHGGGLVWSDSKFFSYSDLDKLYNGTWDRAGRLPFVFSFTCLTGFFESPDYRSLGEEFLRLPQHGCIGFLGASAYTSKKGNLLMDRIFLDNAVNGKFESVGEMIALTKIKMLAAYGNEYLPLINQYNFLGDPALPWALPDTMKISLKKPVMNSGDTLSVSGVCPLVGAGNAKITVGADYRRWTDYAWPVSNGSFSGLCVLKDSLMTSRGFVHAFGWNDSAQFRGWAKFSKSMINFNNVSIMPSNPRFGDSVRISATIGTPDSLRKVNALFCLYAIALRSAASLSFTGVTMFRDSTGAWATIGKVPLTYHGSVGEELLIKFRAVGTGVSDSTDIYHFPILGRPDLLFTGSGPRLLFYNDSLYLNCEVLNAGTIASPPFSISVFGDTIQSSPQLLSLSIKDSIFPGKTRTVGAGVPDTQGLLTFSCIINPTSAFDEINRDNNTARVRRRISYVDMRDVTDTLYSEKRGLSLVPCSRFGVAHRVFLFCDTVASPQPLVTESRWTPLAGDSISRFWTGIRPALGQSDSLNWIFSRSSADAASLSKKSTISSTAKLCVCWFDPAVGLWRVYGGSSDTSKSTCSMRAHQGGPFVLSQVLDSRPPQIRASVDGRDIQFLDYAAKGKPFLLFLTDASGILPSSVRVLLNNKTLDTALVSRVAPQADLKDLSLTAYPGKASAIDSMTVTAQDLAGNDAVSVFAYMPGEDLAIKSFSCHPNPFTARQDNNGATIQTIRFAFLLTDVAKDASIVIYTIANRIVWTWHMTDGVVGYKEVPWDGKTSQGSRIANGTYYAKLTVKNDSKKATSIIRIAKLEGF